MTKKIKAPKAPDKKNIYLREARVEHASSSKDKLIDGYKDPNKVFHAGVDKAIRERIKRMHAHFDLPKSIVSIVCPRISDVLVINKDGRSRELLPDVPSRHVMLCHYSMARVVKSGIGMFSKITTDTDGSWVFRPAAVDMLNVTTVQHVRRRFLWFLRRYSYEISFDGRVEPAMMLYDYGVDPTKKRQRFFVSTEDVQIRDTDKYNTFFRFWREKRNINLP